MKALHDEVEVHKINTAKVSKKGSSFTRESPMTSENKIDRCGYKHEHGRCNMARRAENGIKKKNHCARTCHANRQYANKKMHVVKQKQDSDNCNNETSIGDLEMRSIKAVEDAKK